MKKLCKMILLCIAGLLLVTQAFAANPVNSNATQEARNLLNYLYSVYGNHILSGQEECEYCGDPNQENTWIYNASGKYPAIRGMDLLYRSSTMINRAISWWNSGGIVMIRWHIGATNGADTYDSAKTSCSINNTLTSGTSEYNTFISRLDSSASYLQTLQSNNVPVIYAPWHEAGNGCAWFWWAMEGSSQYQRLWQFMYNYFTKTKGLNNLIWLNPQCGTVSSAYFPGSAWCDFTGGDTYGTGLHSDIFNACKSFAGSMPIALHECGYIPDPGQLQSQGINFVLFSNWNNQWLTDQGASYINTVYNHSFVITRDELPNLKGTGSTTTSTSGSTTTTSTAVTKGDVNRNGTIDIVDALLIAQYVVGLNPANFYAAAADTNCSGAIDIVDALLIAQRYVGIISSFPC